MNGTIAILYCRLLLVRVFSGNHCEGWWQWWGNGADLIARWSKTYRQLGEVSNGLSGRDGIR